MKKRNIWNEIKEFVESYHNGEIITRQNIIYAFNIHSGKPGGTSTSHTTLDVYRRYLTAANYLRHIGRGKYRLAYNPGDISLDACRERAYPGYIKREKERNKRNRRLYA